ncbi:MAG: hypothetical protein K5979_13595 [Ruminococcus sp.]|nr:hypothetical protein [Ruminococcus sp.]
MEYENYFLAFIDILGFKNIINNSEFNQVFDIFKFFINPIKGSYKIENNSELTPLINPDDLKLKIMSDSIVFYIKDDSKNALFSLLSTCSQFQTNLINMEKPILSRGGIVHGQFFIKGDIMFGPALTQAYLLENQNAKYPRIILNKTLLQSLNPEEKELCQNKHLVFEDDDYFYTINFLDHLPPASDDLTKFRNHINSILDTSTDCKIREKYLYLKKIIEKNFPSN